MPSVLDRSALEQSPLADLHLLANELGVDGFRRLRKEDLVDAILERQSGDAPAVAEPEAEPVEAAVAEPQAERDGDADDGPKRGRRGRRGGRGGRRDGDEGGSLVDRDEPVAAAAASDDRPDRGDEKVVEGAVELLANGSGFLRLSPLDPTDDDVYI